MESFNGKARDELFAREIYDTVFEARVLFHDWCDSYNHHRPHSSLGYLPPSVFAGAWKVGVSKRTVRPPNSLLLIGDPAGEPPQSMSGRLVAATTSMVAVGTLSMQDGPTHVRVVVASEAGGTLPTLLAFEGILELQGAILAVTNVFGESYIERPVPTSSPRVQVWVNDASEPNEICVVVLE